MTAAPFNLRFTGTWDTLTTADRRGLLQRPCALAAPVVDATTRILSDVRARGDAALFDMALALDGVKLDSLEVPRASLARALDTVDPQLRAAMERSAHNVATVHRASVPSATEVETEPGIVVGRRPDPLDRVGVYAPGGRAAYPSSVIMAAMPARVAGVREVILASPPEKSGLPPVAVLAAAALCGVDRVFAIGGAGAVAAMAFGTDTIPRVDRIVGPGNAYVTAAKLQVVGYVAIDSPAGPSELLVIADASSDPASVAAEMVAQAEHDPLACVVALVVGNGAAALERELYGQAAAARRRDVVIQALAANGGVLGVGSASQAIEVANTFAPEHLLLAVDCADVLLPRIRNAGAVFVGSASSVTFGDYMTGANHVLPTGGSARCYSGLSSFDFVRWTTYQRVAPAAARSLAGDVAALAEAELLWGHALAARRWSAAS